MTTPTFFATPAKFRAWLRKHHQSETELLVGFHKTHTGEPCMTWAESVDEALCYGWIDGLRKRIDDATYTIRFTPRKTRSVWSAVNVRRVGELVEQGRMQPAGLAVFEARGEAHATGYSLKEWPDDLPPELEKRFKAHKKAWTYWGTQAPWYRRMAIHWVTSAKREETREKRFAQLIEDCEAGRTVKHLTRR